MRWPDGLDIGIGLDSDWCISEIPPHVVSCLHHPKTKSIKLLELLIREPVPCVGSFAWPSPLPVLDPLLPVNEKATFTCFTTQWRIQDLTEEGPPIPQGAPTYEFAKFSQKLHEIERFLDPGGEGPSPLDPPL